MTICEGSGPLFISDKSGKGRSIPENFELSVSMMFWVWVLLMSGDLNGAESLACCLLAKIGVMRLGAGALYESSSEYDRF